MYARNYRSPIPLINPLYYSYKQALHGAQESRKLAEQHSLPFTRPNDYFAEMVKDDIHMERIRTKLLDEAAGMKKSEEAKKQRQLKKFGKQVQVERTKERTQAKKEMLNKVDSLKRSEFDVHNILMRWSHIPVFRTWCYRDGRPA